MHILICYQEAHKHLTEKLLENPDAPDSSLAHEGTGPRPNRQRSKLTKIMCYKLPIWRSLERVLLGEYYANVRLVCDGIKSSI